MKSLNAFLRVLLQDLGERCDVSTDQDLKRILARVEHEGDSFLTITLPTFGKAFERALADGRVADDHFAGFSRHGGLPRFLGGFLQLVFNRSTGVLLDEPSVDAIRSIRQLTLLCGKVLLPCSDERRSAAFDTFIRCEQELEDAMRSLSPEREQAFIRTAKVLFREVFTEVDLAVYNHDLSPRHGPGSTAEKLLGNQKYNLSEWTSRLEEVFPAGEFALASWSHFTLLDGFRFLEPGDERPVRVVDVPKTLKTPRIIAIEPACVQFMQQALMVKIVEGLESSDSLSPLIGFSDQIPNREMAREGSISGALATLDLSEASDRVSNRLVQDLLIHHPHLAAGVDATRSRNADVPGHGVIPLSKFASMGSALCFPFEAMVFLTIVVSRIAWELGTPVTGKLIKSLHGRVRVYGDDIIAPVEFVEAVREELEAFGLRVNVSKTFGSGNFRESCGGDYFAGADVTPARLRRPFPSSLRHTEEIVSACSLRNQLFHLGYAQAVAWLDELLGRILPVYPEVSPDSPALGRHTYEPLQGSRMCVRLHRPLIKACVVKVVTPSDRLDDHGALLKFFLQRKAVPLQSDHLRYAGRARSARITTRWIPVVQYGKVS